MERFAFKIDAALKANLYKICRLCGIDNPCKVPILASRNDIIDLDEPSLSQKVFELVGFTVTRNDKMPQTMCTLCVDKINDFYEFREMCYATNKQTRTLLGLKHAEPQKMMDVKPIIKSEPVTIAPTIGKRGRKRKTEENVAGSSGKQNSTQIDLNSVKDEPINLRKKQRLQQQQQMLIDNKIKEELIEEQEQLTLAEKKRCTVGCSVCSEKFISKERVEAHKSKVHVPRIVRYACYACNQTHHTQSDIKAHQVWHKLSKTPYQCPMCNMSLSNTYAYSRHVKDHMVHTPMELLVLDRECPLCKKKFLTNYFFNTHPCAIRARKCGGCSHPLYSEGLYMRHATHCPKIYLNYSTHILPEGNENEAQMRIKNEFGVDIDDNAMPSMAYIPDNEMQPVVVLERLSSPLLRASGAPNSLGKNNDRVSTKSYLKRVDQLLKNTMSTLVSIKHEPEVHIDDTGPFPHVEQTGSDRDEGPDASDDFHFNAANDDSEEEEPASADVSALAVKQEIIDEAYEQDQIPSIDGVQIKQEPLKLKLKITKNHGQLNSSLIDDDHDSQSKSARKKKKRKHKERNKESEATEGSSPTEANPDDIQMQTPETAEGSSHELVTVKQERVDQSYEEESTVPVEPQATVMTSIPMLQLDNNFSAVNQDSEARQPEAEDVKPNRLELDRLLQITHIASGVVMAEEAMPPESAVEAVPNEISPKPGKKAATKSTARKSTAGVPRGATNASLGAVSAAASSLSEMQLPQIVSVESGTSVPFNMMAVKPEPVNRGYADEEPLTEADRNEQQATAQEEINHNEKTDEETAYINSLDLSNVTIKQEKDLHISDVSINGSEADNVHLNGLQASEYSDNEEEDDDDDSASSADEAEEHMDTYEEEEGIRVYREIDLPPLEEHAPAEKPALETSDGTEHMQAESERVEEESPAEIEQLNAVPSVNDTEVAQLESEQTPPDPSPNEITVTPEKSEELQPGPESHEIQPAVQADLVESETTMTHLASQEIPAEDPPDPAVDSQAEEPQESATSAPAFSFVITSVCSQAVESLPAAEEALEDNNQSLTETLEKTDTCEENVTSAEVNLSAPKDSETLAQPFFDSSTNYTCDEEQQNVLNHELSATEQQDAEQLVLSATADHEETEEAGPSEAASCNELLGQAESSANEETENRINEQQQEQQQQQQQPRCEINDNSNINEIAENNNNANIERELNDDASVAQENPNI